MSLIANLLTRWEFYVTICVIFVVSRIVKWLKDPLRKIPGPRGFPVIGNTLDYSLSKDLHQVFLERSKKYGKIYKDYSLFYGTTVCISDPEYTKQILVTNSTNYNRPIALSKLLPALGNGLLTTNGKEHAIMRKHLNPLFTLGCVKAFIPVFNAKAAQLVKYFEDRINENGGRPIEMGVLQKFTKFTLDVIGKCAFGYEFDGILGGNSEMVDAANTILTANFNVVRRSFEELIPLLKLIPSAEREKAKRAEDMFSKMIREVIDARKEEMEAHPGETIEKTDLLQKLIKMYEEAGLSISNKDLFHQIFTFMLAGHETTSVSMTWFIFLLAKYDELQPRLRKEIEEALDGRSDITFDDLDKLNFLDDCIKETMRLYPTVVYIGRCSLKEDKLGPYTIPPNTRVVLKIGSLGHDPKYWKNPNEFDPDRFKSKADQDKLFPYYFLPFSRGPRMCIGYRFAQMEMKVALARLLSTFSFKLAPSQSESISGQDLLTYKPHPVPIIQITKR